MNANERNVDLRNQPAYALAEASRYLKLPTATLRSWVVGRLYPFVSGETDRRPIAIDPKIAFRRPVALRAGVSTGVIATRIDAGEFPADLADDYDLSLSKNEEAIVYERAA